MSEVLYSARRPEFVVEESLPFYEINGEGREAVWSPVRGFSDFGLACDEADRRQRKHPACRYRVVGRSE